MIRARRPAGLAAIVAVCGAMLVAAGAASAASAAEPDPPVTALEATASADRSPDVIAERRLHPGLTSSADIVDGNWEVGYFAGDREVALVLVDDFTGVRLESWTGYQVAWKMARGYEGSFGHKLNAPYVFLPLCAIFLLGLVDWRRLRRIANLDLLVLLSFGVSNFFFNRAEIGVSVPLQYPPLLYLLGRCLWVGVRGRGEGLRPVWPATWLIVASLFLLGFRGGLNVADSGVIDVGYAGVVGADRIADGEQIYGNFPDDVSQGDTYGPVNYAAYVPFEQIWPWSGSWDDLPAGHGAAVTFDIAVFCALLLLGTRLRPGAEGRRLAATLGFAWAAYPYTAYTLESNSNDSLVALLLIAVMLALSRPALRGAAAALATLTKFVPGILIPMLATYEPPSSERGTGDVGADASAAGGAEQEVGADASAAGGTEWEVSGRGATAPQPRWAPLRDRTRGPGVFVLALAVTSFAVLAQTIFGVGLHEMYTRTIAYQAGRDSPFSIWGQVAGLEPLRLAILGATILGSLALALRPRRKSAVQVAAFAAALLIGLQLTAQHWFYLYIVWFYPLAMVAFAALSPRPGPSPDRSTKPSRPSRPRRLLPSPRRPRQRSRSEPASV